MRLVRALVLFALGLLTAGLAACKGDPVMCEQGCRNYAQLVFWKNAEAKIAAEPAEQRDALRRDMAAKYEADLKRGVERCVSQCQSANNTDDTECMIAAKTADQALACFK